MTWRRWPGRRRWGCSPTGPAGLMRISCWMRSRARWRGRSWPGWTGCRWRSSWPRPGWRRWAWPSCWAGWMTGSRCWPAATGWRRRGSGRWPRRWTGVTSCSMSASGGCSGRWRCSRGRSRWRRPRRWPARTRRWRCCTWWTARCWPPAAGPDGRARYLMLETLRAFGAERLAEAGERDAAAAAMAAFALGWRSRPPPGWHTSAGELAAARWLDAEDATVHQALAWALEHDAASRCGWPWRWLPGGGCAAAGRPGMRCWPRPPRMPHGRRGVVRGAVLARRAGRYRPGREPGPFHRGRGRPGGARALAGAGDGLLAGRRPADPRPDCRGG